MGAWFTEQTATGRTPAEAYRSANADAEAEYGHQHGYSGTINAKDGGFVLVTLPPRLTYAKLQAILEDYDSARWAVEDAKRDLHDYAPYGRVRKGCVAKARKATSALAKAEKAIARLDAKAPTLNLDSLTDTYQDKWGAPLAVEIVGAERSRYFARQQRSRRRGERLFTFFGYAPS